MKKLLLTLSFAVASSLAVNAQIIFSEDFDGIGGPTAGGAGTYTFPPGWFLRNVDNRTPAGAVAYVNEAWERREDFNFSVIDSCAFSTSWYNPVGAADDWMWTPLVGPIGANTELRWNAVAYDPMYQDGYEVRIMTSTQGPPTGGTGVLGNQVTNSTVIFSTAAEASAWTTHNVSLAAYAGQSVYIGFRNNANDKFLLLIDDVVVENILAIDAEMVIADTISEYTLMPQSETTPLTLNGTLRNGGISALSNVYAQVNVYNNAVNVYSASSAVIASLASSATATFTVTSFTPSTPGNYMVEFIAQQGSGTDQQQSDDTLRQYLVVTDSTYARDNGTVVGQLGIGSGQVGYLGQTFVVPNPDLLTSIGMYVTQGYTGRNLALCVWNTNASGIPTTIAYTTDTILYPDDSARYYQLVMSNGPVMVPAGTYVVTGIEFDSTLAIGLTNNIFTVNRTWVNWPGSPFGTWANNEDFGSGFAKSYVIRPNFGDVCLNNTATATSTQASCITCADGTASVTTTGTTGGLTYAWSPAGGTAATATGLLTGNYIVTVTDTFGCVTMDTVFVAYDVCGLFSGTIVSGDATCGTCSDGFAQVTITGGNGPITYSWSNGGTFDTIQNVLPGMYYVTSTDSLGCTRVDSVVVQFGTDIAGINGSGAVTLFPNPSNGVFQVNVNLATSTDITVFITNTLGEVVATKTVSGIQNGRIDMNVELAAGAYNVHVRSTDSEKIVPLNVQK